MHIPHITAPFRPIHHIVSAACGHRILQGAMTLGLFDELAKGPATAGSLANALDTGPDQTKALLEVLVALELVMGEGDTYRNTASAQHYLVQTSDACQAPFLTMLSGLYDKALADIPSRMASTEGEKEKTEEGWANPEVLEAMGRASLRGPVQKTLSFVRALPGFDGFTALCDVGGNHGFYSMALLDTNPGLTATVCDLPHVTGPAGELHAKYGYKNRITVQDLDLETESPKGTYDIILSSHILYSWSGRLPEVIRRLARSLKPGGWLVLNHMAPTDGTPNLINALMNFHTSLSGYPTHFLRPEELESACRECGLTEPRTSFDPDTWNLLFAAQKPTE